MAPPQVSNAAPSFLGAPWCAKIPVGVAFCCGHEGTDGVRLVVFVVVDPESSVVPVSL